jgi:hypothetical protein
MLHFLLSALSLSIFFLDIPSFVPGISINFMSYIFRPPQSVNSDSVIDGWILINILLGCS